MNMLSLDEAYGDGATNDIQDTPGGEKMAPSSAAPPQPLPVYAPPSHPPRPMPNQGGHPGYPGGHPGPPGGHPGYQGGHPGYQGGHPGPPGGQPRRQVRFVNDSPPRFARTDLGGGSTPTWLESNKTLVMVVTGVTLAVLIVVLVVVTRKKGGVAPPVLPLEGGSIPTFVGGHGWDSSGPSYY